MALYPNLVFHTGALLSETLYNFLFLGFLAVSSGRPWPGRAQRADGWPRAAVLFGLAVLVRPISLAVHSVPARGLVVGHPFVGQRALRWTGITLAVVVALRPAVDGSQRGPDARLRPALDEHRGQPLHRPPPRRHRRVRSRQACNSGEGVQFGTNPRSATTTSRPARCSYIEHHLGREPWLVTRRAYYMFRRDDDAVRAVQSYGLDPWISRDVGGGCPGWPTASTPWWRSSGWSVSSVSA